jgi:hypothetical protein
MRSKSVLPAIATGLLLLTGCDIEDIHGSARYREDFHYSYPLKSGGSLSVEAFNGSVDISTWDQATVDISGTKSARLQEDLHDIRVDIDHTSDSCSIRSSRPTSHWGNYGVQYAIKVPNGVVLSRLVTSNGAIRTSDGAGPAHVRTSNGHIDIRRLKGELNVETSNGGVDLLEIDGPAQVRTSNGRIHADGVRGGFEATTSNGSIQAVLDRTKGSVRLQSSNGSIDLAMPPDSQSDVRARTSNSSITVHLPGEVNTRLIASTSNGHITSDFELRTRGEISKHHLEGTIGNGGSLLDLGTSNGSIRIVR